MSHDTDKLIRQLSLVAFLMAERRPLTARDVKQNVEGYQEMSDEAFARRFYSDRAELLALGVPLDSQRDEFTGEELYRLSSRASSRMRSRSGSPSRTSPWGDPASTKRPRRRPARSSCTIPATRRSSRVGWRSSRARSRRTGR